MTDAPDAGRRTATGTGRPVLVTDRLVLRPYRAEDAADLLDWLGDFEVSRWLARVPHPYRPADAEAFVAAGMTGGDVLGFAITLDGDRLIGAVGLDDLSGAPTLGYWLGRYHWGRGLMTEAAAAVVAHAVGPMGLTALHSGVFAGNTASLAIQKRLGFEIVGERMIHSIAQGRAVRHIDTRLVAGRG